MHTVKQIAAHFSAVSQVSNRESGQAGDAEEEVPPDPQQPRAVQFRRRPSAEYLFIVENLKDWQFSLPGHRVISAADYLGSDSGRSQSDLQADLPPNTHTAIVNLCRSYKYLSIGYYCSLLAEARGQLVLPSVATINDLSRKAIYSLDTSELDDALNDILNAHDDLPLPAEFSMNIFFGQTDYAPLAELARRIFEVFPAPMMRVDFEHGSDWHIRGIKMQNIVALNERQAGLFATSLDAFRNRAWAKGSAPRKYRYQLAVLHNPEEALPPSNQAALEQFIKVGRELDVQVSLIEKKDFSHLAEYDGLFIRETTAINHHTYLFAKRAESEGLVVIDDPVSILRCTNKVYLADLMRMNGIPTPRTYVLQEDELADIGRLESEIGYPMVMKVPDGAFSRGVTKVADHGEFQRTAQELLKQSSLILVQEYLYTEFDWRIGVLNKRTLFASQYFMSKGHWQVAKRDASGKAEFGMGCSVPLDEVPPALLDYAVRAANLIGDSLYGVDMKMTARGPVVIEVNDNPNIDVGIEDSVLGDELYRQVLQDFVRRLEIKRQTRALQALPAQAGTRVA